MIPNQPSNSTPDRAQHRPWPVFVAGLTAIGLAALLLQFGAIVTPQESSVEKWLTGFRLVLLVAGCGAVGLGVVRQPRSPVVLGLAAGAAVLASIAIDPSWETMRMPLRVLAVVAAGAALLVRMPQLVQRAAISGMIVFHFGGILTAVTTVPPPNGGAAPWLTSQLWAHVYRPYLQFMYLSNAYHFYSPDPGPATLLWARVDYTDDSYRWITVPNREEHMQDPLALTYYRRLCIAESTNQLMAVNSVTPALAQQRTTAGAQIGIPSPAEIERWMPAVPQHRLPTDYSSAMLSSYARFLVRNYAPEDPAVEVRSVKVYRVVHAMPSPEQVAKGTDPADHTFFLPYFQGEFDRDGRLLDPADPLLYWLIPIVRIPKAAPAGADQFEFINYVEIHAKRKLQRNDP